MEHVIETRNLSRRFGRTEAVADLSLQVPAGSIFASASGFPVRSRSATARRR